MGVPIDDGTHVAELLTEFLMSPSHWKIMIAVHHRESTAGQIEVGAFLQPTKILSLFARPFGNNVVIPLDRDDETQARL